jgi:hypothetical protein
MNRSLTVVTAFLVALICAAAAKNAAPVQVPLPRNNPLKQTEQEKKQKSPAASALFSEKNCQALEGLWQSATTRADVCKGASNFRRQGRRGR